MYSGRQPDHRHHKYLAKMKGFGEYIDWEIARAKRHQYLLVADSDGQVMVNFIGRFERLREDYNDESRDKVAEHWRKDIELFGYEFDGLIDRQSRQ